MALLRSRTQSKIKAAVEADLESATDRLEHRKDRAALRAFKRRVWRGEFASVEQAKAAAVRDLKPGAVSWEGIAAFLERILPLILQILGLFKIV